MDSERFIYKAMKMGAGRDKHSLDSSTEGDVRPAPHPPGGFVSAVLVSFSQ